MKLSPAANGKLHLKADGEPDRSLIEKIKSMKEAILRALPAFVIKDIRTAPPGWPQHAWENCRLDALRFAKEDWTEIAHEAGWQPWELWGCDRYAPYHRIGHLGLVPMINGATITSITESEANFTHGPEVQTQATHATPASSAYGRLPDHDR